MRKLAAASGLLLEFVGVLAIATTGARALYYPFWAVQATHDELARSWGGPGALGATLVHWAVAAGTFVVASLLIRLGRSLRRAPSRVSSDVGRPGATDSSDAPPDRSLGAADTRRTLWRIRAR